MNRIGLVSVTWRKGGPERLAQFTVPEAEREAALVRLAERAGLDEAVYIATCNRVEVVFAGDGRTPLAAYRPRIFTELAGRRPEPGEAERTFHEWAGEGAAEHLLLVTAGLDSARVGETEIAGQVRRAYDTARRAGLVGPRLELLFEEAFRVAGLVHRSTQIGCGRASLSEIAMEHLRTRLSRTGGAVALVGVSDMTRRCAKALSDAGVPFFVVNRTPAKAAALAGEHGGTPLPLDRFREAPPEVEAVLLATGAPGPVLDRAALERLAGRTPSGEAPLVVDMAVPPDVDPEDARLAGVPRVGMAEIIAEAERNRERRLEEMAEARELVDEALLDLRRRLAERLLAPWIAAVQRRYRQTALEGVERLFRRDLKHLQPDMREPLRRWAETLARRFAHLPTNGLRGLAREIGPEAVQAFFSHAEDEALLRNVRELTAGHPAFLIPVGEEEEG
ncbi:MAG: hypothetical protein D6718_03255 [Acidobacteria bacterium]|nr:MAG: hypothetical protein D6718_03255 [Acidobacteriota bacterium]